MNVSVAHWQAWYAKRFEREFHPVTSSGPPEASDEEVHGLLLSDAARGGQTVKGRQVYQEVGCHTCHGGLEQDPGTRGIFGPDLSGVTQRLTPGEIADSIVYPSRQVAERFRAIVVQTTDGELLTGFITDRTDNSISLVDRERVHRVAKESILFEATQETSLMPTRLLNRLSRVEIRDLMAFLRELGSRPPPEPE